MDSDLVLVEKTGNQKRQKHREPESLSLSLSLAPTTTTFESHETTVQQQELTTTTTTTTKLAAQVSETDYGQEGKAMMISEPVQHESKDDLFVKKADNNNNNNSCSLLESKASQKMEQKTEDTEKGTIIDAVKSAQVKETASSKSEPTTDPETTTRLVLGHPEAMSHNQTETHSIKSTESTSIMVSGQAKGSGASLDGESKACHFVNPASADSSRSPQASVNVYPPLVDSSKSPPSSSSSPSSVKEIKEEKKSDPPVKEESKKKPKVATVKLQKGTYTVNDFDVFGSDWDELVRQAAEGLIPDGKVQNPVAGMDKVNSKKAAVFSQDLMDLLAPAPTNNNQANGSVVARSNNQASLENDSHQSDVFTQNRSLPEHVWQDDLSVPSSLGTNRDDFPTLNKFQLAEENSEYDGPDSCRGMVVLKNLDLYFRTYVFPGSVPEVPQALYEQLSDDDNNWQMVSLRYPRIQLWPEDRRWLETSSIYESGQIDDFMANRERFDRVWEEEVLPCGKPAMRRLLPNRSIRLGFHGDPLFTSSVPDPHSASRKVIVCLSCSSFYVIVSDDKVTAKAQERKKKFPVPIPKDSFFRDGPWPHAVARHSFQDLQGITIGFQFQRLTLRFSNPAIRKTDPFTYVLLTSNKLQTVSILQDLQRLVKESSDSASLASDQDGSLHIDNDDRTVLDALSSAVAPDVVGVVYHYQIVQQRWKHGERGTVRRVCVVTDTKILLVDEDYAGDGSGSLDLGSRKMGDVSFRVVDEATLKQVAEVQAAGADPNAITLVINPLSRLSRTHRWRLVCRNREGAERLVEDVRKAVANAD